MKIIDVDDESLARLGQWPGPRIILADVVEKLTKSQAATIAFDGVFADRIGYFQLHHPGETWEGVYVATQK